MAQPKLQQEPTMEEILASIRRIIDSGEDIARPSRSTGHREDSGYRQPEPPQHVEQAYDRRDDTAAAGEFAEPPRAQHEPLNDAGPISRRPAFTFDDEDVSQPPVQEETAEPLQASEPEPELPPVETVFEPQAVYPGTIGEVAQQLREATSEESIREDRGDAVAQQDEPVRDEMPGPDVLLSAGSEQRIGNALHALSDALEREGARKIQDIVVEELRPLLKEWLEQNMPAIVEEMVGKEIERMRTARR